MGTKYGDTPLKNFMIHRISSLETGYVYYEYIHSKGFKIVMREKEDGSEYLYAKGTFGNRDSLSYNTYDKLD